LNNALVPSLLLQPFVENAIRHGISPRLAPGSVKIRAYEREASMVLEVIDDGLGLPEDYTPGIGIDNSRNRLKQLYGAKQSLELLNTEQGTLVRIAMPLRMSDAVEESDYEHQDIDRGRRAPGAATHSFVAKDGL